ncbi:S41 family peptidase [Pedobacter aquatilis]|uniref:S41 family peptidase n=1 Tax=Pedobacter aquatilis TaxID=351343 RepID=UPI00292EE570|nr:S41 family peptidase [Pedobacter aquatilis]
MKCLYLFTICLILTQKLNAQYISKFQAVADIDYYNKALLEVHYNPYLYISEESYRKVTDSLKNSIGDSVSVKSFTMVMSHLTSSIKDGHTMPTIVQQIFKSDFKKNIYFPLELVADKNYNVYLPVQNEQFHIPTGATITSINDLDMKSFYKKASSMIGGLSSYQKEMAINLIGSFLYLADVKPPFKVQYRYKKKENFITIQEGITLKECLAKALPQVNNQKFKFEVKENKIGYLAISTMEPDLKTYTAFFDSCFTALKSKRINTMVIDLRKNLGGNSQIADLLISYFNEKPYSLSGGRFWRVSQRYKDFLTAQGDTSNSYHKKENNSILDYRKCGPHEPMFVNNSLLFTGKVYLLTGPLTFSSANMLADGVKEYRMATVIGQPTGENTNDFGEGYLMELPNSKLKIQTTTTFDLGVDCNLNTSHAVIPDKKIEPSIKNKINKSDPVISYILKTVR